MYEVLLFVPGVVVGLVGVCGLSFGGDAGVGMGPWVALGLFGSFDIFSLGLFGMLFELSPPPCYH